MLPMVLGHEMVGEIVATGPDTRDALGRPLSPGDRIGWSEVHLRRVPRLRRAARAGRVLPPAATASSSAPTFRRSRRPGSPSTRT
ncbi:alcohol dehydrogenase catalytic domain-containing protein [Microbacterium sp. NRRL B-14842]|uniref:hypothetical protein n=1 Tax=Microbacterium sp. NRRL B-14842 TaxID=3162881 RepID=UPI003D29FD87